MLTRVAYFATLAALLAACGAGPDRAEADTADGLDAGSDTETPVDSAVDTTTVDTAHDSADSLPDAAETDADADDAEVVGPPPPAWEPLPAVAPCARDDGAPFLDDALAPLGLTADGLVYDADQLSHSTKYFTGGFLDDAFLLSWQRATLWAPTRAGCFAAAVAVRSDAIVAGAHPVSGLIRHAAALAERWQDGPPLPPDLAAPDLAAAVALACAAGGEVCAPPPSGLPADLDRALVPLVLAIADGLAARRAMVHGAPAITGGWVRSGGLGSSIFAPYAVLEDAAVRAHLVGGAGRPPLNLAAARIAYAVEAIDWTAWRDRADVMAVAIPTPLGWLRIGGAGADTWPGDLGETWLLVDVGGDDHYLFDVGATTEPSHGVNVAIDLGGDDVYAYPEVASPHDAPGLPPADGDGRFAGSDSYGPVTLSRHARQGAGRHGIGMLFDLGGGRDSYRSLSQSQGYAHLGVGVLYDDGGSDSYVSEQASQGNGAYGIGLLVDRGDGADSYRLFSHGQGAGEPLGVGLLFDAGGDDTYVADVGTPELGGTVLYFSPQLPGTANNSGAQGAGLGIRWDERGVFLSGGLGVLRDAGGDDRYQCGVFCQGAGFWQGTGILSDAAGADHYDGLWYVQGGAAHYAIGLLLDGGDGGDGFNETFPPAHVLLGCGHDFSLGMLVNEAGDDRYRFASLALGAGNCNGVGLFVDNGGADSYATTSQASAGYASLGECAVDADRPLARTVGVLLDAGGSDTWAYPADEVSAPGDDARFGRSQTGAATELGVGLDGTGETGIHAR